MVEACRNEEVPRYQIVLLFHSLFELKKHSPVLYVLKVHMHISFYVCIIDRVACEKEIWATSFSKL